MSIGSRLCLAQLGHCLGPAVRAVTVIHYAAAAAAEDEDEDDDDDEEEDKKKKKKKKVKMISINY